MLNPSDLEILMILVRMLLQSQNLLLNILSVNSATAL